MKEIGGYIELDTYRLPMLHEGAVALNCGRNALAYLLEAKSIQKLALPMFLCDSVKELCARMGIDVSYYEIDRDFMPILQELRENEWLYLVNYYGQLTEDAVRQLIARFPHTIVDNAQAYYADPLPGIDTLYTCRKFFGVPDGAFLYTDAVLPRVLPKDESFRRIGYLLGRYERNAGEFYAESAENNHKFSSEPIKTMSKLTQNLLHGLDYAAIGKIRTDNFRCLHSELSRQNQLSLTIPEGAFMYPFWIDNGAQLRKYLQQQKVFVPTLWPNVLREASEDSLAYQFACNIVPIPCDQRYTEEDMRYMIGLIEAFLESKQ